MDDHESLLVGACMLDPSLYGELGRIGHQFDNATLGRVYSLLGERYSAGVPVGDPSVIVSELRAAGLFDPLGGFAAFGRLVADTPTAAGAHYHASLVAEGYRRRRWDSFGDDLAERLASGDISGLSAWVRDTAAQLTDGTSRDASTAAMIDELLGEIREGIGDVLLQGGEPFGDFECGPGLLTSLIAGPGAGKTAFAMQFAFQAAELNSSLSVVVANAETGRKGLMKRELTRRSGVPSRALRFADLTPSQMHAVEAAAAQVRPFAPRFDFLPGPYSLGQIQSLADRKPGLLVVDYLQKFTPPDADPRIGANMVASTLRNLCRDGWAVLALSSVTRQKTKSGSSYDSDSLGLASFKESGEIEFNLDAGYVLRDRGAVDESRPFVRKVELDCVKNRHDEAGNIDLVFDKPQLGFRLREVVETEWVDQDGSEYVTEAFG